MILNLIFKLLLSKINMRGYTYIDFKANKYFKNEISLTIYYIIIMRVEIVITVNAYI